MAVVNKRAAALSDPARETDTKPSVLRKHGALRTSTFEVEVASGDSAGSTYHIATLPADCRLHSISKLRSSGIGGLTDCDFGMAGATDALVDGVSLSAAGAKDATATVAPGDQHKPLWQVLGLSAKPRAPIDLILTINNAASAAGTITADLVYITD